MKKSTGLLQSAAELRRLILDNPTLPLLVFAGEDANIGDYSYMSCSNVRASIGEFLDTKAGDDCKCYTDRDDFFEDIQDSLIDDGDEMTDGEFEEFCKREVAKYDPYWVDCIILYVDN